MLEAFPSAATPWPNPGVLSLQVLYLLGAMLLSMALQLDRHGLWNLLGPSLFALGILATAWVRVERPVKGQQRSRSEYRVLAIWSPI